MNKKATKIIGILLIIIAVIGSFMFMKLSNAAVISNNDSNGIKWSFEISGSNAINVFYSSGTLTDKLEIPSTLTYNNNTYTVTSIKKKSGSNGINIFPDTASKNQIKELVIPDTVQTIGMAAFMGCSNLEKVTFGSRIETIDRNAFYNCSKIKEINLGNNVKTIGSQAFYSVRPEEFVMPDSITSFDSSAFGYSNNSIKKITIGKGYTNNTNTGISALCNKLNALEEIIVSDENTAFSSENGVLFNKNKTQLIKYPNKKVDESYTIPDTITSIGTSAFNYSIVKNVKLNDALVSIADSAFLYSNIEGNLIIPDNVTNIGSSAFSYCNNLTALKLGSKVTTIGNAAFQECSHIKGDLIIPDSVTSIGSTAFSNCKGFDGVLIIGNGIQTIQSRAFENASNFKKAIIGSKVTSVAYGSFIGFSDLWIDNTRGSISFNPGYANYENVYLHYKGDTHNLFISSVPGVKIINTSTNTEVTSGNYDCETEFKFKVEVENGYNYSDLKIIQVTEGDLDNCIVEDYGENKEYNFNRLIRSKSIYIQNLKSGVDLSLRTFITEKNRELVSSPRTPIVRIEDGENKYLHTKYPLAVKTDDTLTYKIRVYNEGLDETSAKEISVIIPEGLEFISDNKLNEDNGWIVGENGKISTKVLANQNIKAYKGNGVIPYKDISIILKVTAQKPETENLLKTVFAEITDSDNDLDSTCGNVQISENYKKDEIYNSKSYSYIKGQEDDDDFETVVLISKIKVEYGIKLNKTDIDANELLKGATFNLVDLDGNIISTVTTDENGTLDFGGLVTYGEGDDIYYIEEAQSPDGYYNSEKKRIKVKVTKTIIDEEKGTYSIKVACDTTDYVVDTSRYEFTPITTVEQLKKVGSGDTVEVDGVKYKYNIDSNYKLMADIDLSASNWTPIQYEIKGVFDGNNHKISNLTIKSDEKLSKSEVGLFRVFSGIVQNLELENVDIDISSGFIDEPETISGKSGIGGFTGIMREGFIINCKVSGKIIAGNDNVGGFVGHTLENGIVRVQKFVNNAEVQGVNKSSNVGGVIGCALGSVSVQNSENYGAITGTNYNVGGLVGSVYPSKYQDLSVGGGFDETNKKIELVVKNEATVGEYNVKLETIIAKTKELLPGAKYTVYNSNKEVMDGLSNITLDSGTLKLFTKDIKSLGIDTYYITENETVSGYSKLDSVIKLKIERFWNSDTSEFEIRAEIELLDNEEFAKDVVDPNESNKQFDSKTGKEFDEGTVFTDTEIEKANWNIEKAEFINCKNTGAITNSYMNAGGLAGLSHGYTYIEKCNNSGEIQATGYGKAAGMIAELYAWKEQTEIKDCENSGHILSAKSTAPAAGMCASIITDVRATNCKNTGMIETHSSGGAGGIFGEGRGKFIINDCTNEGEIQATGEYSYDVNANNGGIIGKVYACYSGDYDWSSSNNPVYTAEDTELVIKNCKNTSNIQSPAHFGGIAGMVISNTVDISNCTVENCKLDDINSADKGGIVGVIRSNSVKITDCKVYKVDMDRSSSQVSSTYGVTGGIVGHYSNTLYVGNLQIKAKDLKIINCKVEDSKVKVKGQSTGGILGATSQENITDSITSIVDCEVKNTEVINTGKVTTYGSVGGICGLAYYGDNFNINNCKATNIKVVCPGETSIDTDAGGICGTSFGIKRVNISNNDIISSNITNPAESDGCGNTGGIIAFIYPGYSYSSSEEISQNIENCNVINTNLTIYSGNVGGIIGTSFQGCKTKVSNCKVTGSKNEQNEYIYKIISYSGTSSNSVSSLGIANSQDDIEIDNVIVKDMSIIHDTKTPNSGTNTAGILGFSIKGAKISECKTIGCDIYSNGHYNGQTGVSAIAGTVNNSTLIENCEVRNTNVLGTRAGNVSGILSDRCGYGDKVVVRNCIVTDSNFTNQLSLKEISSSYGISTAGIGVTMGESVIENIEVNNCNINTKGFCSAGIIGCVTKTVNVSNLSVKNTKIIDTGTNQTSSGYISSRAIGGIVGHAVELDANNLTVDNVTIDSQVTSAGGIAGSIKTLCNLNNSTVNKLTLKNSSELDEVNGSSAGLVGDIETIFGTIKDNKVTNSEITTTCDNTAGLIGTVTSTGTIEKCLVDNVKIENKNSVSALHGNQGGLVAYTHDNFTINDSHVKNSNLIMGNTSGVQKHVGGIVGLSKDININDSSVENTSIINNTLGTTGGMVGMSLYEIINGIETIKTATIKNSSVIGDTDKLISGNNHVGGMIGFGRVVANTNTLTNLTVKSLIESGYSETGGLVGLAIKDSSINGVTANNLTVMSNYNAGGIAGVFNGTIENVNIKDSNISIKENHGPSTAGGIVAVLSGKISNSTVDNNKVSTHGAATSGYEAGGAVGTTSGTVTNCSVTNSTITSDRIAGGVVGTGLTGSTVLSGLTSTGNTINNAEHKGLYIGAPKDNYENNEYSQSSLAKPVVISPEEETTEEEVSTKKLGSKSIKVVSKEENKVEEDLDSKKEKDTAKPEKESDIDSEDKNLDSNEKTKENTEKSSKDLNTENVENSEEEKSEENNSEIVDEISEKNEEEK